MSEWFFIKAYATDMAPSVKPPTDLTLTVIIANITQNFLYIAGILAVIYLIYAGIQYVTASGDATKATAAKTAIVNAIIGIIIIVLALVIPHWVIKAINTGTP